MNKPVGGRGNKASYKTTHVRVPVDIKGRVEELVEQYRLSLTSGELDESTNSLTGLDDTNEQSPEKMLTSLDEALKLAKEILAQKKSAKQSIVKLLTGIYKQEVKPEDLV